MVNSWLGIGVLPLDIARRYSAMFDVRIMALTGTRRGARSRSASSQYDALPIAARLFVDHLMSKRR